MVFLCRLNIVFVIALPLKIYFPLFLVVIFYRAAGIVPEIEHLYRILIKDASRFCRIDIFGTALNQLGVQLFFQRVDVGTDGRLCEIDPLSSFGKTFELHNINKSFQLFKIHNEPHFLKGIGMIDKLNKNTFIITDFDRK